MNAMNRPVSDCLQVLISARRRAESSDASLLHEFVHHRDSDAFAELLRRHGPMVLGLARRIVGDRQTAEDIFQATFLVLARKAPTLRRPESVSAWLHGVAVRLALRTRKVRARRKRQEARAPVTAAVRDPLDELSARELLAVLDEELQRLPENHRLPLILCGLQGLSQEEAARRLGWSAGAVKGRLERGRLHLRRLLAKRGLTLPAALAGSVLLGDWAAAVPPALAVATREAALTGSASAAVMALARHATSVGVAATLSAAGVLVALAGVVSIGLAWCHDAPTLPAHEAAQPTAVQAEADADPQPLPKGAILRLGTLERRAIGAALALSADAKTIVGVRGGRYVQIWDAATGRLKQRRELDDPDPRMDTLSPHGRLLAGESCDAKTVRVWDVFAGKRLRDLPLPATGSGGSSAGGASVGLNALAFEPNETMLAAVFTNDKTSRLLVWDLKRGKEILDKQIPATGWVGSLAYTLDGKRLLVHGTTGLAAYDAATGEQHWLTKEVPHPTWNTITPDGRMLMRGNGILAYDLATGASVPFGKQPPEPFWDGPIAITPDRKTLLVGGPAGVLVWDIAQGKPIRTLAGAGESMVLAPDGRSVLTNNGSLQRWDLTTGNPCYPDTFDDGHVGEVVAIKFSADCKRLASGSLDGTVRLWDTATGKAVRLWHGHAPSRQNRPMSGHGGVTALDIARDGSRVVSAGSEEQLRVWDTATGKQLGAFALPALGAGAYGRHVAALRIRGGGTHIVGLVAARGGFSQAVGDAGPDTRPRLATWELKTGSVVTSVPLDSYRGAFAEHADVLAGDGRVIDGATGRLLIRLEKTESLAPERPEAVSGDGALVVTGLARHGKENGVEFIGPAGGAVWEARTGKLIAQFATQSWFASTAFHPDGRHVAINDLDDIHLVDVATGKVAATFLMPEKIRAATTSGSYASCLAFSADGRRLATGHPDGTIVMWEVKLRKRQATPLGPGEADALWADLANADAARAWRAVWRLSEVPDAAVPLIRKHVQPVLPAADAVTRPLIADLDSDAFDKREAATTALRTLGNRAVPALEAQLAGNVSVETKRRVAALLREMEAVPTVWTRENLAETRAVAALARMDSAAARQALEGFAKGVRLALVTRAARAALGR